MENDTEAFIEILDSYLQINRSRVAKKANIARSTVQQALSKSGNSGKINGNSYAHYASAISI